jgi:hypothetical protein
MTDSYNNDINKRQKQKRWRRLPLSICALQSHTKNVKTDQSDENHSYTVVNQRKDITFPMKESLFAGLPYDPCVIRRHS